MGQTNLNINVIYHQIHALIQTFLLGINYNYRLICINDFTKPSVEMDMIYAIWSSTKMNAIYVYHTPIA